MKLLSLRLRGAIGIYDGLGVDEVNIDFTKFEPGTICVYGDNGAGKTTLIENLTPFRKLFSRPGSLAGQFRLKDSCRDLWVELGPDQYRFLINIKADEGAQKIESYVYRNGEVMNADGKEGSYNDIVFGLFGSPDLFASSLFMPQKRVPFSKLSPERREELFNLEGIQAKSKYAADQSKGLQAQISELTGRVAQLESTIHDMKDIEVSIVIGEGIVAERETSIAAIESRITVLNAELADLDEKAKAQVAIKTELAALEKSISDLRVSKTSVSAEYGKKLQGLETQIGIARAEIETQEKLLDPAKLKRMKELVTRRAELQTEIEKHVDAHGKHVQAKTELSTANSDLELFKTKQIGEINKVEGDIQIANRSVSLMNQVPCQNLADEEERKRCESCQFLKDAVAAQILLTPLTLKIDAQRQIYENDLLALQAKVATAEKFVADNPFDENMAKVCKSELATLNAHKPEDYIQRAEIAETKLSASREKLAGLKAQHSTLKTEQAAKAANAEDEIQGVIILRDLKESQIDKTLDGLVVTTKQRIADANAELQADRDQLTAAKKDIEVFKEQLQQRERAVQQLSEAGKELAILESDQADWTHVSQMLSRNGGFQSYLIETSAVEMTEFANELLKGYDVPWTIEIATSTDTADGKGKKDGFFVFVNTPTGQRELGDLSGGQAVWVDTILQHAVAYAQQRLSGKKLRTKILDEADGALDEERAIAYLNAIQAAHDQTGMHHTILISHRPEIQNMISQRIHFLRGKGIEIERD